MFASIFQGDFKPVSRPPWDPILTPFGEAFCALVLHKVNKHTLLSDVFRHYVFHRCFGIVLVAMLSKCKVSGDGESSRNIVNNEVL